MQESSSQTTVDKKISIFTAIEDIKRNNTGFRICATFMIVYNIIVGIIAGILMLVYFFITRDELTDFSTFLLTNLIFPLLIHMLNVNVIIELVKELIMRKALKTKDFAYNIDADSRANPEVKAIATSRYISRYIRSTPAKSIICTVISSLGCVLSCLCLWIGQPLVSSLTKSINILSAKGVFLVVLLLGIALTVLGIMLIPLVINDMLSVNAASEWDRRIREGATEQSIDRDKSTYAVAREGKAHAYNNDMPINYNADRASSKHSGLMTAAKVFMILRIVTSVWCVLPLLWCIPMTVYCFNKTKKGESVSTGFKIASLIFVTLLGGIFMLCDKN